MLFALSQWSLEPVPVVGCALAAFLYALGTRTLRVPQSRAIAFYAGLALLFLALASPLDALDLRWQWVHMTQHIVLLLIAPPLILLGHPFATAWAGVRTLRPGITPPVWTERVRAASGGGRLALVVLVAFAADMLAWHLPVLYDLTLQNEAVHDLEHTLFLATGLLFWASVLSDGHAWWRLSLGGRGAMLIAGMAVSWALAVIIAYASRPLYAYPVPQGGLSALGDQQIAGGIMWVPGSVPFVVALVWLLIVWFDTEERAQVAASAADRQ